MRDAFTAYCVNMAETADPRLRAAGQGRRLRELTSEQDNLHAALRWTAARQAAEAALRLVRALSGSAWYERNSTSAKAIPRPPRVCAEQLAWLDGEPSVWWHGLRAVLQARLALAVLADGDEDRCRALLADALRIASD